MTFLVKLIEVRETKDEDARKSLQENCTHVANNFWLYEGDEIGLDDGIIFRIVREQAIESYGNLSSGELKKMVSEKYNVDRCFLQ